MKRLVIGVFAQVDAGKTTLSEALLYRAGVLKKPGRVDHGDAFLDHYTLERSRGITIFSKQARFRTKQLEVTLLDTPGHVDFSPEAERCMQIPDYAILIISGTDSVQAHTKTLWKLLRRNHVPTFLFFNKMDLPGSERERLLENAKETLSSQCAEPKDSESVALCDEALLEAYLLNGTITDAAIAAAVTEEKLFPCLFGSALHLDGIDGLLDALERFTVTPQYPSEFSARVFKIAHDWQGNRLTLLKLTGGTLHVRSILHYTAKGVNLEEKVTQIRLYSGRNYMQTEQVEAGAVCAVTGISALQIGDCLGRDCETIAPLLTPVMTYRIKLPAGTDAQAALPKLRQLEAEEPQLHVVWEERLQEIHVQLMGQVQIEVLQELLRERFDLDATIDSGRISYRETIGAPVEGIGHYEPLRHYAEVHLILQPLPRGSGLQFDSNCSEDLLDRNWQRLILTHLAEKQHLGVLTGSPITDLRITLTAGRAHLKHTEGGDFRQATYRAVRQGLMQAQSILLEPIYRFSLRVPAEQIGRAINDIRAMGGSFEAPIQDTSFMRLEGIAPVAKMRNYMLQVTSYTCGQGSLQCELSGYAPCANADNVIAEIGYQAESDTENTADSVFCAHGGGFNVKWQDVAEHMHLESVLRTKEIAETPSVRLRPQNLDLDEKELQKIIEREFGVQQAVVFRPVPKVETAEITLSQPKKEYLIVDGYNMIFAWDGLREQAQNDLAGARERLLNLLDNYCGYHPCELVVVFDSYRVKGGVGSKSTYDHLRVVYTKEKESADLYIEKLVAEIGKNYSVRVASSDAMIQLSALRGGILRMSATELLRQIESASREIAAIIRRLHDEAQRAAIQSSPLREIKLYTKKL